MCIKRRTIEGESGKDIMRRVNIVIGQVHGIGRMLEQQRTFTDIYMQLSAVKSSLKTIEVMLIAQEGKLDKRSAELFRIMSRNMDALKELHW